VNDYQAVLRAMDAEDTEANILNLFNEIETTDLYLKNLMNSISDGIQNQHHKSLKKLKLFSEVIVSTSSYCNSCISNSAFARESSRHSSF